MPLASQRRRPLAALFLACLALGAASGVAAQDGQTIRAPLPPQRPFDLDMPKSRPLPVIVVPVRPVIASVAAPDPAAPPPASNQSIEPDEDVGAEWPRLTPGQKAGAEPGYDPEERPDALGISTDPGTSIACLPQPLKTILQRIADKFGAVKVTSTWRPPWRARRGSYHKRCHAMDFRVPGVRPRSVLDYARSLPEVGGNKVYWNGIIHIDTGPRRAW